MLGHVAPLPQNLTRNLYTVAFMMEDPCYLYETLTRNPTLLTECYGVMDSTIELIPEYALKKARTPIPPINTRIMGYSGSNFIDKVTDINVSNEQDLSTDEERVKVFESQVEPRLRSMLNKTLSKVLSGNQTMARMRMTANNFMVRCFSATNR